MLPTNPTAREVLELFMPSHDLHSVANVSQTRDGAMVYCSCGSRLAITKQLCSIYKVLYVDVINGLRNAPKSKQA